MSDTLPKGHGKSKKHNGSKIGIGIVIMVFIIKLPCMNIYIEM